LIRDTTEGRRFLLTCDDCGVTLASESLDERDALRRGGWGLSADRGDLCPDCSGAHTLANGLSRRFGR
jgi:hypothetical protein